MSEKLPRFNFFTMFRDGFKNMTLGKTLWTIVIIKLIIMFVLLRPLFFSNYLNSNFDNEESKADHVMEQLINASKK